MLGADERLVIAPSRAGAVLVVGWIMFLCLLMVAAAVSEHDPRGLLLVLIWLPWLVPVVLLGRFRLCVVGDVLTYRRPLSTRSWRRDQIAEFGIAQSTWRAGVGYVYMRTLDGEQITFHLAAGSQRRPVKIEGWLAVLRDWLLETPAVNIPLGLGTPVRAESWQKRAFRLLSAGSVARTADPAPVSGG